LNKIVTSYPLALPHGFTLFWSHFAIFSLDLSLMPLNCIVESTFHNMLVFTTLAPILWVAGILLIYCVERRRNLRVGEDTRRQRMSRLKGRCVYAVVIFLCTVFPIVSGTIFETYRYDRRLGNGSAFLVADYRVSETDELHRVYVLYASCMAVLYCLGIPVASWHALRPLKDLIQKLQNIDKLIDDLESRAWNGQDVRADEIDIARRTVESAKQRRKSVAFRALLNEALVIVGEQHISDVGSLKALKNAIIEDNPMLAGLSPLYKDYNSEHWWFQIPNFIVTLCLCGLVTLLGSNGASQVFVSFCLSGAYTLLLANSHPYSNKTDNFLAQFCQVSLTFALGVSVLEQTETSSKDSLFGTLLLICTIVNLMTGAFLASTDFLLEAFPDQFGMLCDFFAQSWIRFKGCFGTVCVFFARWWLRLKKQFEIIYDFFVPWCLRLMRPLSSHGNLNAVVPAEDIPSEGTTDLNNDDTMQGDIQPVAVQSPDFPITGKILLHCG
jgi:hypothetical protein